MNVAEDAEQDKETADKTAPPPMRRAWLPARPTPRPWRRPPKPRPLTPQRQKAEAEDAPAAGEAGEEEEK